MNRMADKGRGVASKRETACLLYCAGAPTRQDLIVGNEGVTLRRTSGWHRVTQRSVRRSYTYQDFGFKT